MWTVFIFMFNCKKCKVVCKKLQYNTPTARTGKILTATPMKKFGEISDLLGTLMWLADDNASGFVTGTFLIMQVLTCGITLRWALLSNRLMEVKV